MLFRSQVAIVRIDDAAITGTTADEVNAQLVGKKIGVCAGFTGGSFVDGDDELEFPGIADAEKREFDNINLAMIELKNGTIDVIIMDDAVSNYAAAADANKDKVRVVDVRLTDEDYGIAVKKGDTELLGKINKALDELKAEGYIDELVKKWITDAQ